MDRRPLTVTVALLTLLAWPLDGRARPRPRPDTGGDVVLRRIDELRRIDVVEEADDQFQMTTPGLVLTFGFDLPDGRRVVEIHEPRSVQASDSSGRDLTAIEENFFGRREHVELIQVWGESPHEFKFKLALPDRGATSLDLDATLQMITDAGSRDVTIEVGRKWAALDPQPLPGTRVMARLVQVRDDMQLELKPGTARTSIEQVQILGVGEPIDSYSSMWNDAGVTYAFQGRLDEGMRVKLTLRTGVREAPVTIALHDQPLP